MLHLHWAAILAHQWRQRFLQVLKKRKNNIAMSGSTNNKKRTQGTVIKMMTNLMVFYFKEKMDLTVTVHLHKSLPERINHLCVFVLSCKSFEETVVHDQEGLKERRMRTLK